MQSCHSSAAVGNGEAKCCNQLARWMVLALTERSFPAHLHSSLLVEEASQGTCNTNVATVHVSKRIAPYLEWF